MTTGFQSVWFEGLRICSLLYADDVVLLVSSDHDLQHPARMRVRHSESETMVQHRIALFELGWCL